MKLTMKCVAFLALMPGVAWADCSVQVPAQVVMAPMTGTQSYGFGNYQVQCSESTPLQLEFPSAGPGGTHELRGNATGMTLPLQTWTVTTRQTVGAAMHGEALGIAGDTASKSIGIEFAIQTNKRPAADVYSATIDINIIF
ncbi:hypothetical protein [Pseudoxanthomonas winnipegensis]|uniref:hypothetical protein n=1 Tax=Pseudoxanthomonas winnipegensis TaxID=2480810 RepID=UPI00103B2318|nr:hypothetical protein [Pseudoxanthomonas winnipegensis]TBV69175.1 hypothetical protein EYC45_19850 [Pseudoxanthomonas winnipegensis]